MAYRKYITEALVVGNRSRNTSDTTYQLFTREAGMLYAYARSVREERSRNRYALQNFSRITVSLVQAKSGWQVTSAEVIENYFLPLTDRKARAYVCDVVRLLRRFVHGEEPHQDLYDDIVLALSNVSDIDLEKLDLVTRVRMLHMLGYIKPIPEIGSVLEAVSPRDAVQGCNNTVSTAILGALQHVETVSHL